MSSSTIYISLAKVDEFFFNNKEIKQELKNEIISTIKEIEAKGDRKWVFTVVDNKYYIDEYSEYNDFVKTYMFRNE
jgi:hypothetical protein